MNYEELMVKSKVDRPFLPQINAEEKSAIVCILVVSRWGRVYQDYLWVTELIGERAPTIR